MKIITLDTLTAILAQMTNMFGSKSLAEHHRHSLDTYILNINPALLEAEASVGILGTGCLGVMILGKES